MRSHDVADGNVAKIAALFPQCVTERLNKDGKPELAIDFDKLRDELSKDLLDGAEERYQFTWPDKRAASRLANESTDKTLRPDVEASVDFWNTENIYIEGDNLDVLKVLRENYLGAIKMIYIDPPYNTGNDFVYNDDFAQSREDFEASSGAFDEEGNQLIDPMQRNTESNGRFHTDWLNMIYPRLKVARDLLSDDGAIFVTLDDNEVYNCRKVMDEIFGANNFVTTIIWENFYGRSNAAAISPAHNYILLYSKAGDNWKNIRNLLPRDEKSIDKYKNPDNDPRGPWRLGPIFANGERHEGLMYSITTPTGKIVSPPKGSHWRMLESDFWKMYDDGRILFGMDGKGSPAIKLFLADVQDGIVPRTIWLHSEVGHTQDGKREIQALFPDEMPFDTPKPTKLISQIIRISCNQEDTILDFFSGSATTAHAVMKLNAEDGGKRKFIMVQLPEVTDEKSEARSAGYETICQIGEERIRRAGKKIKDELFIKADNKELQALTTFAVGKKEVEKDRSLWPDLYDDIEKEEINNEASQIRSQADNIDIGFRVLKLDSSNMEDVFYTPENFDAQNIFTTVDNVKPDRTPLDLLFQVLPELDIELSAKIEEKEVNGKKVFFVDGNYLIATFDTEVNESTVTEIAKMKPQYFVMRDASAANDNVLDNFEQIFRHYSPDTIRKIL